MKLAKVLDIVMLSKFGKNDGGRETWAYTFLPALLEDPIIKRLNIFGYRLKTELDSKEDLLKISQTKGKINPVIFKGDSTIFPRIIPYILNIRNYNKKNKKQRSDLVLGVGGLFECLAILAVSRYRKTRKVLWLRSIFMDEKANRIPSYLDTFLRHCEILVLKKMDILLANGDDIKAYYEARGLKVKVIRNGVDFNRWNLVEFKKKKKIDIVYVGRLSKVKGIESFLGAITKIGANDRSKFNFHVVGDADSYLKQVLEMEQEGQIIYHGLLENKDLPDFLKNKEVCVALTYSSLKGGGGGTSNALLEQMASGRIIVAWDNPIFQQLLNDQNSFLVPQYSETGLIDVFVKIHESLEDVLLTKSNNAKMVAKRLSIPEMVQTFKNWIFVEK